MDLSSLLNAAPAEGNVREEHRQPSQTSPKRSSSSTPTPASVHRAEASSDVVSVADKDADTHAVTSRSDIRVPDPGAYGERLGDLNLNSTHRSMSLEDGQQTDEDEVGYLHQRLAESRLHRFSDSLSSVSSYDSTPSQTHSRTSSVTTVGDDNVASVSYVDAFEDTKLATVQEETSLRGQGKKEEPRGTGRPPRPSLMINTDASNGRNGRRRRHSRTMSSTTGRAGGARSSSGLPDSSLLPPAYGRSSSNNPSQHTFTWHARAASAPGLDSFESSDSGSRQQYTLLQRRRLSTMDRSHDRTNSLDETEEVSVHLPQPASPYVAVARPSDATQEPATPPPSSHAPMLTPQSAASAESSFINSASTSDATLSFRVPVPSTPTRASRTRTETQSSSPSEVDLDQPCYAQEGCMENSVTRKAISHYFGRNKKCTLLIPAHVWIGICRKHYQRTRYRNAETYPMYQIDLVRKQIEKIERWERSFTDKGQPSPIRSWTIALRRRQNQSNALPVPDWIRFASGPGHDTNHVKGVARRIEIDLERKAYNDIPEIEFLPDIVSGVSKSPARRQRKQHMRHAASLSSGTAANLSKTPPSRANVGSSVPTRPLGDPSNSSHQTSQLQERRPVESTCQDIRSSNGDRQAAVEKTRALSHFPVGWQDYVYRPNPLTGHNITGRPQSDPNSIPPPDMVSRQLGPSPLSGSSRVGYRHSNNTIGQGYGYQRPPSSHTSPYTGYGPLRSSNRDGHAASGQLPSFNSGFGSVWDTSVTQEASDPYVMGTVQPEQPPPDYNHYSQPAPSMDSYAPAQAPGRNPFASYTSSYGAGRPEVPPVPTNSPVSWDPRLNPYPVPTYRNEEGLYGASNPGVSNGYYPPANTALDYMSASGNQRGTSTMQPTSAYGYPQTSLSGYGSPHPSHIMGHDNSGQATGPALNGSAQHHHQQSSYNPWTTSMRASTPRDASANSDARAPQADMHGEPPSEK